MGILSDLACDDAPRPTTSGGMQRAQTAYGHRAVAERSQAESRRSAAGESAGRQASRRTRGGRLHLSIRRVQPGRAVAERPVYPSEVAVTVSGRNAAETRQKCGRSPAESFSPQRVFGWLAHAPVCGSRDYLCRGCALVVATAALPWLLACAVVWLMWHCGQRRVRLLFVTFDQQPAGSACRLHFVCNDFAPRSASAEGCTLREKATCQVGHRLPASSFWLAIRRHPRREQGLEQQGSPDA